MIDYVFFDYVLKSIANYGFPAACAIALYFDLRKEIRENTQSTKDLIVLIKEKI